MQHVRIKSRTLSCNWITSILLQYWKPKLAAAYAKTAPNSYGDMGLHFAATLVNLGDDDHATQTSQGLQGKLVYSFVVVLPASFGKI